MTRRCDDWMVVIVLAVIGLYAMPDSVIAGGYLPSPPWVPPHTMPMPGENGDDGGADDDSGGNGPTPDNPNEEEEDENDNDEEGTNDCGDNDNSDSAPAATQSFNPLASGGPVPSFPLVPTKSLVLSGLWWVSNPVAFHTGELFLGTVDMSWPHDGTWVSLYRRYNESATGCDDFGPTFSTNLRIFVTEEDAAKSSVNLGSGPALEFIRFPGLEDFDITPGLSRFQLSEVGLTQYRLTDQNGYKFWFNPNANPANLISTRNRYGQGEDYFYDGSSRLTKITTVDSNKNIHIQRDTAGAITRVYDYAQRTVDYEYNGSCQLTKVKDACGSCSTLPTAEYNYDVFSAVTHLSAIKDANGSTVLEFDFDNSGRVLSQVDANGGTLSYSYGSPISVTDPEGSVFEYEFDNNLLTKKTALMGPGAADNIVCEFKWDSNFALTYRLIPPPDIPLDEDPVNSKCQGALTECCKYDENGHITGIEVNCGTNTISVARSDYSNYGDCVRAIYFVDALDNTTFFEYDNNCSLTQVIRANDTTRNFAYDGKGLLTLAIDATDNSTAYEYDSMGFRTQRKVDSGVGGLALVTKYTVDSLGRRLTVETPEGRKRIREFDKGGRRTKFTSPVSIVTAYDYDANGRLTDRTLNDGGSPTYTNEFEYDVLGLVTKKIDRQGLTSTFSYDLDRRLTLATRPGDREAAITYDQLDRLITRETGSTTNKITERIITYSKGGRILTIENALGNKTEYDYDGFGRRITTTLPTDDYIVHENDDLFRQTSFRVYAGSGGDPLTRDDVVFDSVGLRITKLRKANPDASSGTTVATDDEFTEMEYDNEDRLLSRKMYYGASTSNDTVFEYDSAGRLITLADPDDFNIVFAYDDDDRRTGVTDANNHATTYDYDDDSRLTKQTNPLGDYTETTYDVRGLQTDVSNYASGGTPYLNQTTLTYDDAGRQTVIRNHSDPGGGQKVLDRVRKTFYDDGGDVTKTTSASDFDTTYDYDEHGRQTRVTLPDGSYTTGSYDLNGNLTSEVVYEIVGGNTRSFRTDFVYDALNRLITTTNQGPDGTFGNNDDQDIVFVYDGAGRQISLTDEAGRHTVTGYDAFGRETKLTEDSGGIGRVTEFAYDRAGRLDEIIAKNSNTGDQTTRYAYNGRGLRTIVTYEDTGDVTLDYDAVGNMVTRTDEENISVVYTYDAADRPVERKKSGSTNNIERYDYDGLGRLVTAEKGTSADPDAVSRSIFTFDSLSQLEQESQAIAGGTAKMVGYDYDKGGNRIEMIHHDNVATASYAYDKRDRCTQIDDGTTRLADYIWLGGAVNSRTVTCDYPNITKPKFESDYQRDGLLRVTLLTHDHLTANMADSGYSSLGTFDYTYDTASNVLTADQTASIGELDVDRDYRYDTLNRLTHVDLDERQAFNLAWTPTNSTYEYDDLGNRKTHIQRGGPFYIQQPTLVYQHDKANRMTKITGQGALSGISTPKYDKAGNQTRAYSADRSTFYTYLYDHNNRLTAIKGTTTARKAAYTYDALGRRIEFIDDFNTRTTRYYYDGGNEILETTHGDIDLRHYIHGISDVDERLMMMKHHGDPDQDKPYYYVLDRQYSVWMVVDRGGAIVERYAYDPYGRPLIRQSAGRGDMNNDTDINGTDSSRFILAFNGIIWDSRADMNDDGLVNGTDNGLFGTAATTWTETSPTVAQAFSDVFNPYMFQGRPHFAIDTALSATVGKLMVNDHRNRFSDPITGRWLTRDPLEYVDSYNLYEYLLSNPVTESDPFGGTCQENAENESCKARCKQLTIACIRSGIVLPSKCQACRKPCEANCDKRFPADRDSDDPPPFTGNEEADLWWFKNEGARDCGANTSPDPLITGRASVTNLHEREKAYFVCMVSCILDVIDPLGELRGEAEDEAIEAIEKEVKKRGDKIAKTSFKLMKTVKKGLGIWGNVDKVWEIYKCHNKCKDEAGL